MVYDCPSDRRPAQRRRSAHAFTLIEILVVIVIIGILVTISLVVGKQVRTGGQSRSTEDTIRILDQSLVEYEKATRELPASKFVYRNILNSPKPYEYPLVDGRRDLPLDNFDKDAFPAIPTGARYTAMCASVPEADSLLKGINSKLVRFAVIDPALKVSPPAVEVLDSFGRPIRFVHPAFDGGYGDAFDPAPIATRDMKITVVTDAGSNVDPLGTTYRRSAHPANPAKTYTGTPVGDADEGICPSRRPYFYSAGPDGDPGTRSNNVYTTRPTYPTETAMIK